MSLSIVLAQKNWRVGDIEGNAQQIVELISRHSSDDLIVFSELALCGYPPEDLVYRSDFKDRCQRALALIQQASEHCAIIVGHPHWQDEHIYNALSFFCDGKLLACYHKQLLPNYDVFDEKRYFTAGDQTCVINFKGQKIGLLICEDLWQNQPIDDIKQAQVDFVVAINASPYDYEKQQQRYDLVKQHAKRTGLAIVYVNQVGGQDELVFDGGSFICNEHGEIVCQLNSFEEQIVAFQLGINHPAIIDKNENNQLASVYDALVLATRDYVTKNGFQGAVLGLSGGIDSALTLAIAVDALGKDKVQAVMMPFRYTADISIADAKEEAEILGVEFDIVSIEPMFDAFMSSLSPLFLDTQKDTTEENLQARCRGVILMALSNKRRSLVLTTGNKSEMSVGYATLYGDMAGGFDVLKDVPKTMVFALSKYRNTRSYVIPERVITRPPSAELAPDQKDEDSLPPYDILDGILKGYIEQDLSIEQLIAQGYDEATVRRVIKLVDMNEYKRRQSAVGPKITTRNFGKGRRYPITSAFGFKNW
ncbi:NAD+ synthase [Gilliamella sp. App6-5]|uniref:NAD+ synthase n=1 Tax=Gilliamella sp. App6-5 TaxID=3120232 RepID=UPI00080E9D4E|nr:NAD+ synthase [Gilliamella apicola]OCG14575.1 NAD+ synthase [Gilliamella apicola]